MAGGPAEPGLRDLRGLRDERAELPVLQSEVLMRGRVFDVQADTVDLGAGGTVTRQVVRHPGAVAVVALDDDDAVVLVRQYRHPARSYLWEVPAGLLDVPGEPLLDAARRELAEESDLRAGRWHTLADFWTSPGGSDEALRVFLARDLEAVPEPERFERGEEELDMPTVRVPLDEAVAMVLSGRMHNPSAVIGVLAARTAREQGWTALRPADAPWIR